MPDPVSWFVVVPGWDVVTTDGERVGAVLEVLGDQNADIFDGLAVDPGLLRKPKYVPAERVPEIFEGRVELGMSKAEFETLPDYDGTPAVA